MATPDETTNEAGETPAGQAQTSGAPPPRRPPEVQALALEVSQLQKRLEASEKRYGDLKGQHERLGAELAGVRTAAERERIVGAISGEFVSPAAVKAMASHVWDDVVGRLERAEGMDDAAFESAKAQALRDHLASIDNGALLRGQPSTQGGGDINQGRRVVAPRSIYSIPKGA